VQSVEEYALDVACLSDELREELDLGGVRHAEVWRALTTLRKVRFVNPSGRTAVLRALSA
jgi:hypothetical protein